MIDARWSNPYRSLRHPGALELLLLRSSPLPAGDVKVTVRFSTSFTVSHASLITGEPPVTRVLTGASGSTWTCSLTENDRWTGLVLRIKTNVPEGRRVDRYKVGSVLAEATGQPASSRPLEIEYVNEQDERLQHSDELTMTFGVLAFDPDESTREAARWRAVMLLEKRTGSPPVNSPQPDRVRADKQPQEEGPSSRTPPVGPAQPPSPPPTPPPPSTRSERASTKPLATAQPPRAREERFEQELRELHREFEVSQSPGIKELRSCQVNTLGVQLTLSIDLSAWPLMPPSVTVDPRWRHRTISARGQVVMSCLRNWNQTFPLAHVVRSFEHEWRKSPGRWREGEPWLRALWRLVRGKKGDDSE